MARKRWDGTVPFDSDGNLLYDAPDHGPNMMSLVPGAYPSQPGKLVQAYFWKNRVFDATLIYRGFVRGNSTIRFLFDVDEPGNPAFRACMFLSDFDRAMKVYGFTGQTITGRWTYRKMGRYYGICVKE